MHPHEALIRRFYEAFTRRDGPAMAACYGPDAHFSDRVFVNLEGEQVGAMWTMLCERGKDLTIACEEASADDDGGRARWRATYTFTATGRPVVNVVDATFKFADGLIVDHRDDFDFWKWSRQALGPIGLVLGWSGFLQTKVRRTADASLKAYMRGR